MIGYKEATGKEVTRQGKNQTSRKGDRYEKVRSDSADSYDACDVCGAVNVGNVH